LMKPIKNFQTYHSKLIFKIIFKLECDETVMIIEFE